MGKVSEDKTHLEGEKDVCKCDARCTNASGPVCVCECHSANHGKGVAGWTKVTILETIPTLICNNPEVAEKHRKIASDLLEQEVKLTGLINRAYGPKYDPSRECWQTLERGRKEGLVLYYMKGLNHRIRMTHLVDLEKELTTIISTRPAQTEENKEESK
jgi:hypothetical protein